MKVLINKPEDSIDLNMVTEDMYFVSMYKGVPRTILSRHDFKSGNYRFVGLHHFTQCDNYVNATTLAGAISEQILAGHEVHAFRTYQEAFKFIADNL